MSCTLVNAHVRSRRGQVKILEIQSSPRGESSDSNTLTTSFIEACRSDNTSIVVDTLNVWHERLPGEGRRAKRLWCDWLTGFLTSSRALRHDGGWVLGWIGARPAGSGLPGPLSVWSQQG